MLERVTELLGHEDRQVVWTALAVLNDRHLPARLVVLGVSRLLAADDADDWVLASFLRGRTLPDEAAQAVGAWLAADPLTRWPIATELDWPAPFTSILAAGVRAMAAAKVVDETAAFADLVADTAERWLTSAPEEGWATVARAALARLRSRPRDNPGPPIPTSGREAPRQQRLGSRPPPAQPGREDVGPLHG